MSEEFYDLFGSWNLAIDSIEPRRKIGPDYGFHISVCGPLSDYVGALTSEIIISGPAAA
jgi:hypothetical protein